MKITEANLEHVENIVQFQLFMAKETENMVLDNDTVMQGVKAVIEDPMKGKYLIAMEQGNVLGCCMITYEWSDWRNATIWWLQSLYITPEHRGKGVFTAMFNHIKEQIIASEKVCGLRLYVDHTNKKAQMIYHHLGMTNEHYSTFEWMND